MIESLTLRDYRGFESVTVPLSQFTLIYGDNATGKTSILEALQLLGDSLDRHPQDPLVGRLAPQWLARSGSQRCLLIQARGRGPLLPWSYKIEFSNDLDRREVSGAMGPVVSGNARSLSLRFDAQRLAEPSTSAEEIPRVQANGDGLATTLLYLKIQHSKQFEPSRSAPARSCRGLRG